MPSIEENEEIINKEIEYLSSKNQSLSTELNDILSQIITKQEIISKEKLSHEGQISELEQTVQSILEENGKLDYSASSIEAEISDLNEQINSLQSSNKEKEIQFKKMLESRRSNKY